MVQRVPRRPGVQLEVDADNVRLIDFPVHPGIRIRCGTADGPVTGVLWRADGGLTLDLEDLTPC